MSTSFRQYIQIKKEKDKDNNPYYHEFLNDVIEGLEKPYHFIDFETSGVAIPFHKNRYPYESVAFQYSYHLFDDDKIVSLDKVSVPASVTVPKPTSNSPFEFVMA